ncbi:unnamed protein product, partial [Nippostrongylus brasiliensis]|uniref:CUB domain-containing protein n=1 Tax=Nippostrongylus brasiliensis TaxID=27835 RepID=A0A158R3I4_NIPBR
MLPAACSSSVLSNRNTLQRRVKKAQRDVVLDLVTSTIDVFLSKPCDEPQVLTIRIPDMSITVAEKNKRREKKKSEEEGEPSRQKAPPSGGQSESNVAPAQASPDNCGDLLLADIEPKEFTAVVEETNREDFNKCTYMIKAPHGTRAVIELVEFGPDHIASEGCTYGGVEIKAQEDQRLTGYRFCSQDDSKTEIISKTELVPIIIYNRHNFTS